MPDEKSCGVVLFSQNRPRKYLLLHYEEGHWDFPKGHIESGEADREAAVRETMEETGISGLNFISGFSERIEYFYKNERKTMHKEVLFFLAGTAQDTVRLSHEHVGYAWLSYEKAYERLTYSNARQVLKKAEDFLIRTAVTRSSSVRESGVF